MEQHKGGPVLRSDAALFGRCEFGGNLEGGEIMEGLGDLPEAVLYGGGLWGKGVGCITTEHRAGVAQQGAPITVVGDGVSAHQCESLPGRQPVPLDDTDQVVLVAGGKGTEAVSEGRPDGTRGQFLLGCEREVTADLQAALHPLAAFAEQTGNLADA